VPGEIQEETAAQQKIKSNVTGQAWLGVLLAGNDAVSSKFQLRPKEKLPYG
jgi:hypothetical protein